MPARSTSAPNVFRAFVLAVVPLLVPAAGCASCSQEPEQKRAAVESPNDSVIDSNPDPDPVYSERPRPDKAADPDDPNTLVYLVGTDDRLYSFSPRIPGRGAYRLVGKLDCPSHGSPQSMSVDRHGSAWVFYNSGELFKVDIRTAKCAPTSYVHPSRSRLLGMGFTSASAGSTEERLYISSPDFGLATVSMPGLNVAPIAKFSGAAELTGGGDGRLFRFQADTAELSEIDLSTNQQKHIHHFHLGNVAAFAFARYAGKFYVFTSDNLEQSRATEYDPKTDKEVMRDPAVGLVVVGAGQSTLAPRSDVGAGISETFQ